MRFEMMILKFIPAHYNLCYCLSIAKIMIFCITIAI
jgi:hypothetical protein